ncbi:MAG: hypothetical protein ABSH17_14150 [Syntrophobacteraceae bacterium]
MDGIRQKLGEFLKDFPRKFATGGDDVWTTEIKNEFVFKNFPGMRAEML